MSLETPDAALARLRQRARAWREVPGEERLERCGAVLDAWRRPDFGPRRALAAELAAVAGFSAQNVARGLSLGLAEWSREALAAVVREELGGPAQLAGAGFETTALLLAGAIPMPTLQGILAPLLLGSAVLVKPSARDPVSPRIVAESLSHLDAELAGCVALTPFASDDEAALTALLAADCIVATGSDASVAAVSARVAPPRRLVARGHRLSVAVLGPSGGVRAPMERLALDVALWDQLGCLSPVALYVLEGDGPRCDEAAEELAGALAELEARMPRGEIDPEAAARIAQERAAAEMRAAAGAAVGLRASPGTAWTVVREADAMARTAPLHRFVRVHPVADAAALERALLPLARHLAAIGAAGLPLEALRGLGAPRLCPLGRLQAPPLSWCHDAEGMLTPLAR